MKNPSVRARFIFGCLLLPVLLLPGRLAAKDIVFCGELIPVSNDFVANKLMNVIRQQIPTANLPSLKQKAMLWFPYIEKCLKAYGIPEDFKYLPIVESGFTNATSRAGAFGFWQLMPETAKQYNLIVNSFLDERNDPVKATAVACRLIRDNYNYIRKQSRINSWVLTAAAYNTGAGNMLKAVRSQGADYFSMDLNPETAEYVYKIIAVKELFENPEIYMKGFGVNVFSPAANTRPLAASVSGKEPDREFATLRVNTSQEAVKKEEQETKTVYITAHVADKKAAYKDEDLISLELDTDFNTPCGFLKKGNVLKGQVWVIDGRLMVDLGCGAGVQVLDNGLIKGLSPEALKAKKVFVMIRAEVPSE